MSNWAKSLSKAGDRVDKETTTVAKPRAVYVASGKGRSREERFVLVRVKIDGRERKRLVDCRRYSMAAVQVANELGLHTSAAKKELEAVVDMAHQQKATFRVATRPGWQNSSFVMPDASVIGEPIRALPRHREDVKYKFAPSRSRLGSQRLLRLARGNPILLSMLATALVGPIMQWADVKSFILQLYGLPGIAKTLIGAAAGSVWGKERGEDTFIELWNTTDNAVERTAAAHSGTLLVLDETSLQLEGTQAKMLLAAQTRLVLDVGKRRLNEGEPERWRVPIISTSNRSTASICEMARQPIPPMFTGRVLDLPLSRRSVVKNLHGHPDRSAFFARLAKIAKRSYGHTGRDWLKKLVGMEHEDKGSGRRQVVEFQARYARRRLQDGDAADHRTTRVFSTIYAAAMLARKLKVVPWTTKEIYKSIRRLERLNARANRAAEQSSAMRRDPTDLMTEHFTQNRGSLLVVDQTHALPPDHHHESCAGYILDEDWLLLPVTVAKNVVGNAAYGPLLKSLVDKGVLKIGSGGKFVMKKTVAKGERRTGLVLRRSAMGV